MQFENPQIMVLTPIFVAVIWILLRQRTHIGFSSLALLKGVRTINLDLLQKILLTVVVITILAAIAGPYEEIIEPVPSFKEGRDLILLLDVSTSMEYPAEVDQEEKKIEIAKRVAGDFVEERISDRIALISFETKPTLAWPLDFDHNPVMEEIESLETSGGTKIAIALKTALDHFDILGESESKVIILVSDGLSTIRMKDGDEIISRIQEGGIHLYWIWIKGERVNDRAIETVVELMEEVGGKIYETKPSELATIFEEIGRLEANPITFEEKVQRIYLHQPLILAALILFIPTLVVELIREVS